MKTRFIVGTNEQYSIREDGVVTRHYRHYCDINDGMKKKISYKDVVLSPKLYKGHVMLSIRLSNKKHKRYMLSLLLIEYFSENPYKNSAFKISYKDGNPLNYTLNNLDIIPREGRNMFKSEEEAKKHRNNLSRIRNNKIYHETKNDPEVVKRLRANTKRNYYKRKEENPEEFKRKASLRNKKANAKSIKNITRSYVSSKLNIKVEELTEELYNHYRDTLLFKRKVVEENNISINSLS